MGTADLIRTILEVAAVLLVTYGILHEDKVIKFENKIIRFIAHKIRMRKRRKKQR